MIRDLFETPELLPKNVQKILEKNENMDLNYTSCRNLIDQLEAVGYTCDYGLDAIPIYLRQLPGQDVKEVILELKKLKNKITSLEIFVFVTLIVFLIAIILK